MESGKQGIKKRIPFFAFGFLVVGCFASFFGVSGLYKAIASSRWPEAPGVILESNVVYQKSNSGSSGSTYKAEVFYEFRVRSVAYNGNTVAYGDFGSSDPARARRIVNAYPRRKSVQVSYSPDNPEVNVLEPGLKFQAFLLPLAGIIFLASGIFILVSGDKKTQMRMDGIKRTEPPTNKSQ